MKTHFWQSTRVAGSHRWRLARLRATIPLVVLGLVYVLTLGGLPEAAGGLPGYFTDVKPVANVNSSSESITQWAPRISRDGLELYFTRWEGDRVFETADLWVATRPSTLVDFGEPVRLGPGVNTDIFEAYGHTSSDGLRMYFTRLSRDGSRADIYVATRLSTDDEFDNAVPLDSLNTLFRRERKYLPVARRTHDLLSHVRSNRPRQ